MINFTNITSRDISQVFFFAKGFIGPIKIDSFISENHKSSSEITQHPVETGADITDNIQSRSRELSITGAVMNFQSSLSQNTTIGQIGETYFRLKNLYDTASNLTEDDFTNLIASFTGGRLGDRSASAFSKLLEIQQNSEVFNIQTGLSYYQNMAIDSIDCYRDERHPNMMLFTIRMLQLRFTTLQRVSIDSSNYRAGVIRDQASSSVERGSISGARVNLGSGSGSVNSRNSSSLPSVAAQRAQFAQYGLGDAVAESVARFRGVTGDSVLTRALRAVGTIGN